MNIDIWSQTAIAGRNARLTNIDASSASEDVEMLGKVKHILLWTLNSEHFVPNCAMQKLKTDWHWVTSKIVYWFKQARRFNGHSLFGITISFNDYTHKNLQTVPPLFRNVYKHLSYKWQREIFYIYLFENIANQRKDNIREEIRWKKSLTFGHCPN